MRKKPTTKNTKRKTSKHNRRAQHPHSSAISQLLGDCWSVFVVCYYKEEQSSCCYLITLDCTCVYIPTTTMSEVPDHLQVTFCYLLFVGCCCVLWLFSTVWYSYVVYNPSASYWAYIVYCILSSAYHNQYPFNHVGKDYICHIYSWIVVVWIVF